MASNKVRGLDMLRALLTHSYNANLNNKNKLPKHVRVQVDSLQREIAYILDDKPVIEAISRLAFVLNNASGDPSMLLTNLAVAKERLQEEVQ